MKSVGSILMGRFLIGFTTALFSALTPLYSIFCDLA